MTMLSSGTVPPTHPSYIEGGGRCELEYRILGPRFMDFSWVNLVLFTIYSSIQVHPLQRAPFQILLTSVFNINSPILKYRSGIDRSEKYSIR